MPHGKGSLTTLHRVQISMGPPLVQFSTRANVRLPLVSPNGTTIAATFMLTFCDIFKLFLVFITALAIIGAPLNSGMPLHVSAAVGGQYCIHIVKFVGGGKLPWLHVKLKKLTFIGMFSRLICKTHESFSPPLYGFKHQRL